MSERELEQAARDSIEAFNRSDWQALRDLFGPGYIYEETGTGTRTEGAEDTIAGFQAWKTAMPDGTGDVLRVVVDGDQTVLEIMWRGTQTGPLASSAGELPPSGRRAEILATVWQRWQDGKLVHERHHLDVLSFLVQLGALPEPTSA